MTQVDEGPESLRTPDVLTVGAAAVGEVLAERYRLEAHISNDAYGRQVWRGLDVLLRRPIAVILREPGGPAAAEMLQAAVQASRVQHPHLVDIYDAIDEGGKAYVVREWVVGLSLQDAVAEAPMEPERATTVARSIADAVAALHAAGLTHGNIHPGTVMLGDDGQVRLTDARSDDSATPDSDVRGGRRRALRRADRPLALPRGRQSQPARRAPGQHHRDTRPPAPDPWRHPRPPLRPGQRPARPGGRAASADVLAAALTRLDAEREEEFLDTDDQYGIGGGFLPVSTRLEPRRPAGRKLAIGVAGLLVLALVGLLIGAKVLGGGNPAKGAAPATSNSAGGVTKPGGGETKVLTLQASQVSLVTPNNSRDNANEAGLMVDGNTETHWETDHYPTSSEYFTTNKRGHRRPDRPRFGPVGFRGDRRLRQPGRHRGPPNRRLRLRRNRRRRRQDRQAVPGGLRGRARWARHTTSSRRRTPRPPGTC